MDTGRGRKPHWLYRAVASGGRLVLRPIRPGAVRLIWWPRLTCRLRPSVAILIALLAFGAVSLLAPAPGLAQGVNNLLKFPPRPAPPPKEKQKSSPHNPPPPPPPLGVVFCVSRGKKNNQPSLFPRRAARPRRRQ